jgi:hypothetical protein
MLILKHRFDYFPSIERLVLSMPTKVHEADFAKDIRDVGSATIRPRDLEYGTHNPDSSFQHLKSPSPTVIIKVAHS